MEEKLKDLSVVELRKLAKDRGIAGTSGLRKAELIEKLTAESAPAAEKTESVSKAAERPQKRVRNTAPAANDVPETVPARSARPAAERVRGGYKAPEDAPRMGNEPDSAETVPTARRPERREYASRTGGSRTQTNRVKTGDSGRVRPDGKNVLNRNARIVRNSRNERTERSYEKRTPAARNEMDAPAEQRAAEIRTAEPGFPENRPESRMDNRSENRTDNRAENRTDNRTDNRAGEMRVTEQRAPENRMNDSRTYENSVPGRGQENKAPDFNELDSGVEAHGILEVMQEGFGFIRCENFLPGEDDVYVAPSQIRRFGLRTGDMIRGRKRVKSATEKFGALLYINDVNGYPAATLARRPKFADLTPIFPNERIRLERPNEENSVALRVMDLLSPIGKGQRGMIVSPPKAGKTTLLKQVAKSVTEQYPEMHLIILLIDERPEEVTDMKESVTGSQVEVIYSTFDEQADNHRRVSEMVIERARRLVEHGRDVMILLDSITRLTRAYNQTVPPSGRTLSGGLDPAALYMPKRFFGAARNIREGGSLTILATALIDTGSRMDDVVYEEFKGTGNMEIVLNRKLSEKRIFPAIDILATGTRRDDLLLTPGEQEASDIIHRATNSTRPEDSVEKILDLFAHTKNNSEFVALTRRRRMF
ncbi:MAG: transcription termination factor Rho [[Clostridium] aminophilum]|uniref:transcription termination factor Rho n=1 Tax=[Clostridium] aminophilum TaxID=1526 RepID=UPI0026E9CF54|nr:transcription termination factor Rho [[Clostridium] aminophilum]MDD6196683.1 transcription termination factor Rho [[Clostridium] aminophilum]